VCAGHLLGLGFWPFFGANCASRFSARCLRNSTGATCGDIVEKSGARWFVLSARHGLVAPGDEIAPYDHTLNAMGLAERKEWASHVLDKLFPQLSNEKRVVVFAGRRYREFLVEPLRQRGIEVQVPMADLARGKQLAWLSDLE
jgi:hypothetical protein